MKTKIPYSPPSMEVVKLKVNSCLCQASTQRVINQLMLMETFEYQDGDWDDADWENNFN